MDRAQFWSMIEIARQASGGDVQQQAAALKSVPLCVKDLSGSSEVLGVTRSSGGAGAAADAGQVPGRRPWHTSGGVPASREEVRACARSFPRPQRPADHAAWGGASTRESYHDRASPQHQL
jgi:hypothetical protein